VRCLGELVLLSLSSSSVVGRTAVWDGMSGGVEIWSGRSYGRWADLCSCRWSGAAPAGQAREVSAGANGSARRRFGSQPEVEDDPDFGSHMPTVEGGNEWDKVGAKLSFHLSWRRNG
jgi:hypothetical protein